tara:strand:+ start:346 stop:546 length:201 start_codon:yes stop_codon:yes gene_type:complete
MLYKSYLKELNELQVIQNNYYIELKKQASSYNNGGIGQVNQDTLDLFDDTIHKVELLKVKINNISY